MPAEPDSLAYMADDKSSNFDLPRWQTHHPALDPFASTQASHHYSAAAPPPPQSLTAGRLPPIQASPAQSRQPRISQLLDQDHHPAGLSSSPQYLSPSQNQLSRSISLSAATPPRSRRHHQPEDLENTDSQDYASPRQQRSAGAGFYPPSATAYHSQSMPGQSTQAIALTGSSPGGGDSYSDMYYSPGSGPPPKRSQATHDAGHNAPQQSPYSPSNVFTSYTSSSSEQRPAAAYHSHSRSHSSVKQEAMTPPVASPYSPQVPLHSSATYQSPFTLDTSNSSHTPSSQTQNHLNAHLPRQTPASTPSSPLSYMRQSPSQYFSSQDQPMVVDLPPPKRRVSGFRQVRDARDLQPRLDIPPTNRRMDSAGAYLSPLRQLTTNVLETYHICNPQFRYESAHNPRRVLTKPSKPAHNDGYDNEDYDYILYVNDWLGSEEGHKYLILDILGQGTFGQVVKCQNMKTHEIVAVKVVKNKPAYFNQSMMEVTILEMLNKTCDPNDEHHILRLRDSFIHKSHLCLVFELLSSNLYELIKQNQFQGLSTQLVKVFMAQLLDAMTVLKDARLIHCDLKPENILLKSLQSPTIKVIDFGSACHERQTVYTYIQSRFYRSPEVLLGMGYTAAIDMWSLGCIAVELFLGLPLFPGTSEYNQLTRIVEMLGLPPLSMLNTGKQTAQFFDSYEAWNPHLNQTEKKYRLKSIEQYSREHNTNEQPGKQYFKATTLPDIINTAPMPTFKSSRHGQELERELNNRASFIDFCQGLLNLNPVIRWTPQQARLHPFITGEKFTKPFVPDGITPPPPAAVQGDSKRPYGGLVPSQPKGTRAYQDAASYNQHLAQHQVFTAQAASQANNTYRNPYLQNQQQSSSQQQSPQISTQSQPSAYDSSSGYQSQQQQQQQQSQYSTSQSSGGHRGLTHQTSAGHLSSYNQQYPNPPPPAANTSNNSLAPTAPSNSYYPSSRNRANTINQMDSVPPALARLQHMNQDIIAGRNALTPVLNRDDAMREWERRQAGGKANAAQPYPQLEYLQQQAEMAAASGMTGWVQSHNNAARYQAPPSKLAHSYNPQQNVPPTIMVDEDRRDVVMSNVRSAARGDGGANAAAMYSGASTGGVISSPPQAYSGNSTTAGNRYPGAYTQQQQGQASSPFDSVERRTDIGNMYLPMQPEQYQFGAGTGTGQNSSRNLPPTSPAAAATSFYSANIVPSGQGVPQQQRNAFGSVSDASQQPVPPMPMPDIKGSRRNSGMDMWPR